MYIELWNMLSVLWCISFFLYYLKINRIDLNQVLRNDELRLFICECCCHSDWLAQLSSNHRRNSPHVWRHQVTRGHIVLASNLISCVIFGLQFNCAASSLIADQEKEVWFCSSDSSAGHVCRLSVCDRPTLIDSAIIPDCHSKVNCICATPGSESHISTSTLAPSPCSSHLLLPPPCQNAKIIVTTVVSKEHRWNTGEIYSSISPSVGIVYLSVCVMVRQLEEGRWLNSHH